MLLQEPTDSCNIFLAYRQGQDEGDTCAKSLHDNLEGSEIRFVNGRLSRIQVYWDRDAAAMSDWRDQWRVALKTCRAMILVCTAGTGKPRQGHDWLYEEVDWWVRHRKTAPILVDACELGTASVPQRLLEKWPYVQRVAWKATDEDSARLLSQVREGIVLSESGITTEELLSSIRKMRTIRALTVAVILLVIAAVSLTIIGVVSFGAFDSVQGRFESNGHMGPDPAKTQLAAEDAFITKIEIMGIVGVGIVVLVAVSLLAGLVFFIRHLIRRRRHI